MIAAREHYFMSVQAFFETVATAMPFSSSAALASFALRRAASSVSIRMSFHGESLLLDHLTCVCDLCRTQARSMRVVGGEAVDVVGGLGKPWAEAVDETLQALEQNLVAGVEGGQSLSRGFGLLGKG
jgi:hypothetical protein